MRLTASLLGATALGAAMIMASTAGAVELEVTIPNLPHDEAQKLADKAHEVCPYSKATRGNIDVKVSVVED